MTKKRLQQIEQGSLQMTKAELVKRLNSANRQIEAYAEKQGQLTDELKLTNQQIDRYVEVIKQHKEDADARNELMAQMERRLAELGEADAHIKDARNEANKAVARLSGYKEAMQDSLKSFLKHTGGY